MYLDVKYMTASRNYEFLNTGTRLNANVTLYRCTILTCITILTSGLPKIIISEHICSPTFSLENGIFTLYVIVSQLNK